MRCLLAIALGSFASGSILADDPPTPLPAETVARTMQLPKGFQASVFAAEPDVVQPIAFTFDDRGRLWVVECLSYPDWQPTDKPGQDRVSIFEDQNGDGQFDRKTVFYNKGRNLTGIALGFGGVWLCSTPNLVFIPDKNHDDEPDGPPEILLDGWSLEAKHNAFNGLTWGPDGWLYGMNGILSNSLVGKPGTPKEDRAPMSCGVWRIHPVTRKFEVVMHGTTNPWGLDYDPFGEFFITNCVIKHLFHVVPGGHFDRMYGQDLNPYVYKLMSSCADYLHWGGGPWQSSRGGDGIHDAAGGGHAHAGCMIYQGDNWPAKYRGRLFTCNIHGKRVNSDVLNQHQSGYRSERAPDFLKVADPWFRGLELKTGPDGGVFLTDWSDIGECHDYRDIHRENGRIFKITHGTPTPFSGDLAKLSPDELLERQHHPNAWHARHARRILFERRVAGDLPKDFAERVWSRFQAAENVSLRLRWLWTLHLVQEKGLTEPQATQILKMKEPHLRVWAVRLSLEDGTISPAFLEQLARLAKMDDSPRVRLALASGLQRLSFEHRWKIAEALLGHAGDGNDPNLPLMIWYGIEPLAEQNPAKSLRLVAKCRIPLIRQFLARRAATAER